MKQSLWKIGQDHQEEILTEDNPNLIVSIKTDPEARYEFFVDVIDAIKQAGNDKISIAEPDFWREKTWRKFVSKKDQV